MEREANGLLDRNRYSPFFQFLIGLKKVLKTNCGTTKYTNTPWTLHEHTMDTPRFVLFFVLHNSH
jgi:hypothetical protein